MAETQCFCNQSEFVFSLYSPVSELSEKIACQPRETLVKVYEEFPQELQYTIMPRCVPVNRCSGCCADEVATCIPGKNKTVEFQVRVMLFKIDLCKKNCPDSLDILDSDLMLNKILVLFFLE